jgi:hypothetical protein
MNFRKNAPGNDVKGGSKPIASSQKAPCKPIASRYIFIASHEIEGGKNTGFPTF